MIRRLSFLFEAMRNGQPYAVCNAIPGGSIICAANAEIKRSISCTLQIPPGVDLLRDNLRVSMVLNGVTYRLGTFVVTTAPRSVSGSGETTYNIEGYDLSYILERRKLGTNRAGFIAGGTVYTTAIETMLFNAGFTDYLITPSALTITTAREDWDVGTSYMQIINQLLDEINYTPLWVDSNGFVRIEPYVSPIVRDPNISYLSGRDSLILRSHYVSDDIYEAANVFTVGCDGLTSGSKIYATSVNDDPSSRLSTVQRGRIVAPVVMLSDVANYVTAQAYADKLKFESMISTETVEVETAIQPGHELYDIVQIQLPELAGKFEEVGWTIPLDASATMTHTLRRAVYV